jgi:opacity protein-like surface antigen
MVRRGKGKRSTWGRGWVIVLLAIGFLLPAPTPVLALNTNLAIGCTILGVLATPVIVYGVWRMLPQNREHEGYLNGEWYAGGFLGAAFTPSQDLRYPDGFSLNNRVTRPTSHGPATLFNNQFDTSLVGGLKLGYFTHTIPYLGLEVESMVNNSFVNRQRLSTNSPIQGATQVTVPNDPWINWTTALHVVGRYGFLPDKEVPFGRLQPYAGIGPAFIVLYEEVDSAKNFGVDMMAGVRYMITKHISTFVEYKFNYQWDVEIESHAFYLPDGTRGMGTAHLDFATQKVVFGLAYHW